MKHMKKLVPNITKYDVLKTFPGNRKNKVTKELEDSINKKGCVDPVNVVLYKGMSHSHGLYTADGETRLKIFKKLHKPYDYYIVGEVDNDKEMVELIMVYNSTSKPWVISDFLHLFVSFKIPSYMFLQRLHDTYNISLTTLVRFLTGDMSIGARKTLKDGKFKILYRDLTLEKIDEIIAIKNECHPDIKMTERQNIGFSMFYDAQQGEYSRKRMLSAIQSAKTLKKGFKRCSEKTDAKKMFEKLYG